MESFLSLKKRASRGHTQALKMLQMGGPKSSRTKPHSQPRPRPWPCAGGCRGVVHLKDQASCPVPSLDTGPETRLSWTPTLQLWANFASCLRPVPGFLYPCQLLLQKPSGTNSGKVRYHAFDAFPSALSADSVKKKKKWWDH